MAARRAFFWPPGRILARKSVFCYRTPNFVKGPFVAVGETVHFQPLDQFFDFLFLSYGLFCKRKRPTRQKVFPHPTVGAPSARSRPSALRDTHARAGLAKKRLFGQKLAKGGENSSENIVNKIHRRLHLCFQ